MAVEVKVLVSDAGWAALQPHIPADAEAKKRSLWFFDTPEQDLRGQELVLRLRLNARKTKAESTAKWRRWVSPYAPVRAAWSEVPGFKAEIDATLTERAPAWSITEEGVDIEAVTEAIRGEGPVKALFGEHQQRLVEAAAPLLPWRQLVAWGPIAAVKWGLPGDIDLERWTVEGDSVIELSCRGEAEQPLFDRILGFLRGCELDGASLPGGKTAWAFRTMHRP
jgi:hypothetical protein